MRLERDLYRKFDFGAGAILGALALVVVLAFGCDAGPLGAAETVPSVAASFVPGARVQRPAEDDVATAISVPRPADPTPAPVQPDPPRPSPPAQQVCPAPLAMHWSLLASGWWTVRGVLNVSDASAVRVTLTDHTRGVGLDVAVAADGSFVPNALLAQDRSVVAVGYRVAGGCTSATWCWRLAGAAEVVACP